MKVLLIGDYCIDCFIEGDVERLSPEMPVPVFVETSRKETPGMGGNVLANLNSLAPELEVETWFPLQRSTKTRYLDRKTGHHFLRVDCEITPRAMGCGPIIEDYAAIVVSDYDKGYLTYDTLTDINAHCEKTGTPFFVDTKRLLGAWSSVAIAKINEAEYRHQIANHVTACQCCRHLIVTASGAGMTLFSNQGTNDYHVPAVPIEVRDGAGCGDSVLAALVVRYLENGGNLKTAMEWAGKVGAIAVSKRGVVAVKREEVE